MSSAGLVPLHSRPGDISIIEHGSRRREKARLPSTRRCHAAFFRILCLRPSSIWRPRNNVSGLSVCRCVRAQAEAFSGRLLVCSRRGTGSHFVTQRPSDPRIQRPKDPVDPVVTLFYNELQMSTYVAGKRLQRARGLPVFIAVWRLHASEK